MMPYIHYQLHVNEIVVDISHRGNKLRLIYPGNFHDLTSKTMAQLATHARLMAKRLAKQNRPF